jgi:hypothetical protein
MLPEMTMKSINDLQVLFKKGHIGWTDSGNVKMDEGTGGDTMTLAIKGTKYDEGNKEEEDKGKLIVKHCDGGRFKFCNSDLGTAYFWAYIKMTGLTTLSMQNIDKLGLADGIGSALVCT